MNWSAPIDAKKYTSAIEICLNIWIWMRKEIVSIQGFDGFLRRANVFGRPQIKSNSMEA